ncbi:hypothetical protein ACVGWK_03535, partial [Enterobacter sichuanensis]
PPPPPNLLQQITQKPGLKLLSGGGVFVYKRLGVGSVVNVYYAIITDITCQRAAEDAMGVPLQVLGRVTRATTVGQVTSSIAHEINQPLMSIVSNAGASLR